jgi:hypothetical protein
LTAGGAGSASGKSRVKRFLHELGGARRARNSVMLGKDQMNGATRQQL